MSGRTAGRLFQPVRIDRFCPAEHCSKRCGTDGLHLPAVLVIQPTFEHRQLRLINDFTAINPRRTK